MKQAFFRTGGWLCTPRAADRQAGNRPLAVLLWVVFALLAAAQILAAPAGGKGVASLLILGALFLFCAAITAAGGICRFPLLRVLGGWLAFAGVLVRLPEAGAAVLFALLFAMFPTVLGFSWLEFFLFGTPAAAAFLIIFVQAGELAGAVAVLLPAAAFAGCGVWLSLCAGVRQAERIAALERRAERDPLTDTLNRSALEERFSAVAARGNFGLAVADLDHFKAVNDHGGHTAGDAALVGFCRFTERFFEERKIPFVLSRFGGDEFVLLFPDAVSEQALRRVTDEFCGILRGERGARPLPCSCSVGLVFSAEANEDLAAVLKEADRQLYLAKNHLRRLRRS